MEEAILKEEEERKQPKERKESNRRKRKKEKKRKLEKLEKAGDTPHGDGEKDEGKWTRTTKSWQWPAAAGVAVTSGSAAASQGRAN